MAVSLNWESCCRWHYNRSPSVWCLAEFLKTPISRRCAPLHPVFKYFDHCLEGLLCQGFNSKLPGARCLDQGLGDGHDGSAIKLNPNKRQIRVFVSVVWRPRKPGRRTTLGASMCTSEQEQCTSFDQTSPRDQNICNLAANMA